jgi:glycosyltransferase involved in cell wall biosynthesis
VSDVRTVGLVYGHRLDFGGVESHLLSLISRSDPARWRWRVLASTSPSFAARAAKAGADIEHWAPRCALDVLAVRALVRGVRARSLDLLHVHDPRALPIARAAAAFLRIPLVYTVHLPVTGDTGHGSGARRRLYGIAEGALLRLAPPGRIVHVSARSLAASGQAGANRRLVLVPNGVDLERAPAPHPRDRVRAVLGVRPDACAAVSVARLVPQKGLDVLLDALASAADGSNLELWLAGDGPERAALEARAVRLGLVGRVRFLGRRDDVPDLLAAGDLFVLASRHETTPIALLEAMAAGRACIATDVGDCPAMLAHGEAGRIVAPGDVRGLAAALLAVAADGGLRERLGRSARDRARLFSDLTMAERTAAVYETVLAS